MKVHFQLPKKVYKNRDKAKVCYSSSQYYTRSNRHHFTMTLLARFPEKPAFLNKGKMIDACQNHLWFRKEITLLLLLECLVGFPHKRLQRQELGFFFFFFFLGEGRGGGWLLVFVFSSKSPDLQQHFLVLFLEFRQDGNTA